MSSKIKKSAYNFEKNVKTNAKNIERNEAKKMKIKRILSLILAFALVLGFTGCMNRDENSDPNSTPEISEGDELVIYHSSTELAPMLMAITEEYSKTTGKKVSAKLAGNDFMGEMQSKNAAIYVVDTNSDLSEWHSGGLFSDLMNNSGLSSAIPEIHPGLQLNPSGIGSYGIPLMLEGYGYIIDKDMFSALFGAENSEKLIDDLRTCSFTEFEGFVAAADTYISAPSAAEITVNGNKYTFEAEKTGKAKNLTGVFSLNSESTRVMEHLLSAALAAKFASRYEVMTASEETVSEMEDILEAYAEVLDLHTSNIAGVEGSIGRGEEFTGGDYNYSTSVDLFTRGNALFYPGGTSDAADFEESAEGFGKNLDIIPMKLPLSDEDITASGMTAEKLQSSIVIGSRYYITLNPKADETSSGAARDFINWMYSEAAGKNAYSSAFGGVPFNFEYLMNNGASGEETPSGEGSSSGGESGEPSSGTESFADQTESGTVSPEKATPSGTGEKDQAGAENENSGTSADKNTSGGNTSGGGASEGNTSGENSSEENPGMTAPMDQSHNISSGLMASVAEYYAAGNWIPDLSFALPADFSEKILGESLSDYWGMETWAESDRENFVDTIIGGWKERLDKENAAVG